MGFFKVFFALAVMIFFSFCASYLEREMMKEAIVSFFLGVVFAIGLISISVETEELRGSDNAKKRNKNN